MIKAIESELGISPGETTADGKFSLELVNCLGSCALAPVMVIDETYHTQMTMEKLKDAINEY
jgi:NADH-quinone oxidoreductase subunit E